MRAPLAGLARAKRWLARLGGLGGLPPNHGRFLWPSFTSTTMSSAVLRSGEFLGVGAEHGERTAFQIRSVEGRDISAYSFFGSNGSAPDEKEVLLLPGACFDAEAKGIVRHPSNKVTEVKAQQLKTTNKANVGGGGGSSNNSSDASGPKSLYEDLYASVGSIAAEPVYATVAPESFIDGGLWWQPVHALASAMFSQQGESVNDGQTTLQQQAQGKQGARIRSNTDWSNRCARGHATGGRKCNNRAVPGGKHCEGHTCPHMNCTRSKSSTEAACANHAGAALAAVAAGGTPAHLPLSGAGGLLSSGSAAAAAAKPKRVRARGKKAHASSGKYGFGGGVKAGVSVYNGFETEQDEEV